MSKILVIADQQDGQLKKSTFNVLHAAKELAGHLGASMDIAIVGGDVSGLTESLTGFGAGTVYTVSGASFERYLAQPYTHAVAQLVDHTNASIVCGSSGTTGKDYLPRVAASIGAGMVADCIGFTTDDGSVKYLRPMYAGNIIATVKVNAAKTVLSFRTSEFDAAEPGEGTSAVEALDVEPGEYAMRYVSFDGTESERPDLGDADVIVSGGRGLKDGSQFYQLLEPLADVLGAAIGASRAAVDGGFCPNDMQIGQTGKVVAPNLYFAIAISGAIQHLAGMKNSNTIVAINKDGDEPIFQVADYGLVADAFQAVPELVEKLKAQE
jgi:electron transfer flavoprotein alpha subunit